MTLFDKSITPKRIVLTGPESTGKTSLFTELKLHFDAFFVEEYSRIYLEENGSDYDLKDLKKIEEGQQRLERIAIESNASIIVQDTDFLTLWIWYRFKYGIYPDRVYNYLQRHLPSFYLLLYPDLEWVNDGFRENPTDLLALFGLYEEEIQKLGVPYSIIKGKGKVRIQNCVHEIQENL